MRILGFVAPASTGAEGRAVTCRRVEVPPLERPVARSGVHRQTAGIADDAALTFVNRHHAGTRAEAGVVVSHAIGPAGRFEEAWGCASARPADRRVVDRKCGADLYASASCNIATGRASPRSP